MIYINIYIIINHNDSLYLYNPLLQTKKTKMQKCKNANILRENFALSIILFIFAAD